MKHFAGIITKVGPVAGSVGLILYGIMMVVEFKDFTKRKVYNAKERRSNKEIEIPCYSMEWIEDRFNLNEKEEEDAAK